MLLLSHHQLLCGTCKSLWLKFRHRDLQELGGANPTQTVPNPTSAFLPAGIQEYKWSPPSLGLSWDFTCQKVPKLHSPNRKSQTSIQRYSTFPPTWLYVGWHMGWQVSSLLQVWKVERSILQASPGFLSATARTWTWFQNQDFSLLFWHKTRLLRALTTTSHVKRLLRIFCYTSIHLQTSTQNPDWQKKTTGFATWQLRLQRLQCFNHF